MKVHVKDITKETLEKIKKQLEQGKDFNLICGDMRIPEIERDALMDRLVKEADYQIKD